LTAHDPRRRSIVVVGSGTRFLSGISIYTMRLANALAERHRVSLITMRQLIPARLYPGWKRVGSDLTKLDRDPQVAVFDGIDWYWLPSMIRGAWFLLRRRPEVVIFEWWTATVVHSYIALAILARLWGAKVIVEFHEIIATEELRMGPVRRYVKAMTPILMRLASGFAVHSDFDRQLAIDTWSVAGRPMAVLPHGPHDHYQSDATRVERLRDAPETVCNLLFFGVIRPYKGLEHLVRAFEALPESEIGRYWLTVVGETWEGWALPTDLIAGSPRRERITLVNRYVTDAELHGYLEGADAVVLPYLRSSLSGPLHVAMGYGLPIVMTDVGGNAEAAQGYEGIVLVPPGDSAALMEALRQLPLLAGRRFAHPHTWAQTAEAYDRLMDQLD
jgi:glycosyltransferase involved in cell wall biosynthesis